MEEGREGQEKKRNKIARRAVQEREIQPRFHYFISEAESRRTMGRPRKVDTTESHGMSPISYPNADGKKETSRSREGYAALLRKLLDPCQ